MPFLNPTLFLVGMASVTIPIAIHILMRRRRKPVPWAAMKFLMEAYRQQRRRTRLEQLLLLATRCLLVAALAFALGRPAMRSAGFFDAAGPRTLVLVVDNGLTTGLAEGGGIELDGYKKQADTLIKELSSARGDRVAVVTTGSPATALVSPASPDLAGVAEAVRQIAPTESGSDLSAALGLVREITSGADVAGTPSVVLLSPWRAGSADVARPLAPLGDGGRVRVASSAPVERAVTNVTVLDVTAARAVLIAPETESGTITAQVRVSLRRTGTLPAATTTLDVRAVGVSGTASPSSTTAVAWQSGQATTTVGATVEVPAALVRQGPAIAIGASVSEDALPADDVFVRPLASRRQVRVVILAARSGAAGSTPDGYSPSDWLGLALAPAASALDRRGAEIDVSVIDPTTPGAVNDILSADAIFVAAPDRLEEAGLQALRRALDAGRLIVVTPPPALGAMAWTDRFVSAMGVPWSFAREVREYPQEQTLALPAATDAGLFALLGPELAELVKPVRVSRMLPAAPNADSSARVLLSLTDGAPLMMSTVGGEGGGMVVYLAVSPELSWTNLPAMPLMVPVVQETLRQGLGEAAGSWAAVAGRGVQWPRGAEQFRAITTPWRRAAAEPMPPRSPSAAGVFRTVDAGGRTLGVLAVNAEPDAGRVETVPRVELERWLGGLSGGKVAWLDGEEVRSADGSAVAAREEQSTPVDLVLLMVAAALALAELAMSRWFSHATVAGRSPGLSAALPTGGGIVPTHPAGATETAGAGGGGG